MSLLQELEPLKLSIKNLSLGEIMRGTRTLIGMKQWKLAELLKVKVSHVKTLESNSYKEPPSKDEIKNFCELFGYDFSLVWDSVKSHVLKHKNSMMIFGKNNFYNKDNNNAV